MAIERQGIEILSLEEQKTKFWDLAFVWFCANVAVPRLLMGGTLSGLGLLNTIILLLVGNFIVILPLLFLGVMGFKLRLPTMAVSRLTFGIKGSFLPSIANSIQLVGWAAVVTIVCSLSVNSIIYVLAGYDNLTLWIIIVGIIQLLITAYGFRSIAWLQRIATPLLVILSFYAAYLVITSYGWSNLMIIVPVATITIFVGLDILAANAFAWGPMVADYTRYAKDHGAAGGGTLVGSLVGAAGFMFVGAVSGLATGDPNPAGFLVQLGLGIPALLIIVLSSLTTNVLNIYSSAISFNNVAPKILPWKVILVAGVCVIGVALIPGFIDNFIGFLLVVGSLFVPLIAIMLADYFIVKKQNVVLEDLLVTDEKSTYWYNSGFNYKSLLAWALGITFYHLTQAFWPAIGSSIPTFIFTVIVCLLLSYKELLKKS